MPVDDDGSQWGFGALEREFRSLGVPLRMVPALERPNTDHLLARWELFAHDKRTPSDAPGADDARLYLDVKALEHLLEQARSSMTQRAVIHGLVIEVELRRDTSGHVYRVAKFRGAPAPEWSSAAGDQITRSGG